jgi:hypothetical protein
LERLAYKLLQEIAENIEDNMTIKQMDDEWFREINKEAIVDAIDKYEIKIETGTSSYDTLENRREDAIARGNIALQYAGAGVPVNLEESFKDTLGTFEGVNADKYINKQPMQWLPWMWWMPGMGWGQLEQPPIPWSEAAATVEAVAQWGITAGL